MADLASRARLPDVRQRLQRLRTVANQEIRQLTGETKEDYRTMVRYVQLLYDTPAYLNFHREVADIFSDLPSVRPGTVGAYFGGCLASPPSGSACSVICAGQMPLPNRSTDPSHACPAIVLLALPNGSGYSFQKIYQGTGRDLLVFIDAKSNTFTGFNGEEKETLRKFGPNRIQILQYTGEGSQYNDITGGFCDLRDVPSRMDTIEEITPLPESKRRLYIILTILLVIFILFVGWKLASPDAEEEE